MFTLLHHHVPAMTPAREVRVRPFAMARRVLLDLGALDRAAPAGTMSADEVVQRISRDGFRFPSEAEWEYVAREGRRQAFVLGAAAVFFEGAPPRDETAWGVVGPERTVWLGDRWHASYQGAPGDASPWTEGDGAPA